MNFLHHKGAIITKTSLLMWRMEIVYYKNHTKVHVYRQRILLLLRHAYIYCTLVRTEILCVKTMQCATD
jgi:hypothetical protein